MIRTHISLPVRSIEATRDFYTALFGQGPVKEKPDYVKFLPDAVALNISFHASPQTVAAQHERADLHVGLEYDDLEELGVAYERLLARGLVDSDRATGVCCYARQDKFWVKDPDGYRWELYVLLQDTATRNDATPCCGSEASACC